MKTLQITLSLILLIFSINLKGQSSLISENATSEQTNYNCDTKVSLVNNTGIIIAAVCPSSTGDFSFTGLTDQDYTIVIDHADKTKSETFNVTTTSGQVNGNILSFSAEKKSISNSKKEDLLVTVLPNPVREEGEVQFTLTENANTCIIITNAKGKIVANLPLGMIETGTNRINLNVDGLQGLYFVTIQAGSQSGNCKMFVK